MYYEFNNIFFVKDYLNIEPIYEFMKDNNLLCNYVGFATCNKGIITTDNRCISIKKNTNNIENQIIDNRKNNLVQEIIVYYNNNILSISKAYNNINTLILMLEICDIRIYNNDLKYNDHIYGVDKVVTSFYFTTIYPKDIILSNIIELENVNDGCNYYLVKYLLNKCKIQRIALYSTFKMDKKLWPTHIDEIYIDYTFNQKVDSKLLPDSYTKLELNKSQSLISIDFPSTLKKLHLGDKYKYPYTSISNIEELYIGNAFYHKIEACYIENLKVLHLGNSFNKNIFFSSLEKLEELRLGDSFNMGLELPNSLKKLYIGFDFDQELLFLPDSLEELVIGNMFNSNIILPANIKKVIFGNRFNKKLTIPLSLTYLKVGRAFAKSCNYIKQACSIYIKHEMQKIIFKGDNITFFI